MRTDVSNKCLCINFKNYEFFHSFPQNQFILLTTSDSAICLNYCIQHLSPFFCNKLLRIVAKNTRNITRAFIYEKAFTQQNEFHILRLSIKNSSEWTLQYYVFATTVLTFTKKWVQSTSMMSIKHVLLTIRDKKNYAITFNYTRVYIKHLLRHFS